MDQAQLIATILSSSVISGVLVKLIDWARDARAGHMQKRRAEVDKAIAERDEARRERDTARAEVAWYARWVRILEEHTAIVRRKFIDAPCTEIDDLDPYPPRPSREPI